MASAVRVTSQEFRRLVKRHAQTAPWTSRCWHDVLIREKGKRREYRCAVCNEPMTGEKANAT